MKVEPKSECNPDGSDNEKPVEDEERDVSREIKIQSHGSESASSTVDINMNAEPEPKSDSAIKSDVDVPKPDGDLIEDRNNNNNDDDDDAEEGEEEEEEGAFNVFIDEGVLVGAGEDLGAAEYLAFGEGGKSCAVEYGLDARSGEDEDTQVSQLALKEIVLEQHR